MRKKLMILISSLVLILSYSVVAYGNDYTKNDNVTWLDVDGKNLNDVYETGTVEGVTYEANTNTVILKDVNLTMKDSQDEDSYRAFISYDGDIPLNIEIQGNNTITGMEDGDSYINDFLSAESSTDGKNSSVNIYGGGTLNLNKIENVIYNHITEFSRGCTTSVSDVTINSNGGGFYSLTGNLNISNSTIKINNSAGKGNEGGICIGSSLDEYGGKVDIKNSLIEIKTKNSEEGFYRTAVESRFLNVNGLNIYVGGTSAQKLVNETTLLKDGGGKDDMCPNYPMKWTQSNIGYVLITSQKLNIIKDTHTNCYIKGKKSSTYFSTGYTGDKVCRTCGKIVMFGKNTAKKNLNAPNVSGGKKKITIKYKKITGATGFQIRYKKAGGKWVVKKYQGNKNCSKTIKGLKKSAKYTVQLRAISGKKYSNWSKGKVVKIK